MHDSGSGEALGLEQRSGPERGESACSVRAHHRRAHPAGACRDHRSAHEVPTTPNARACTRHAPAPDPVPSDGAVGVHRQVFTVGRVHDSGWTSVHRTTFLDSTTISTPHTGSLGRAVTCRIVRSAQVRVSVHPHLRILGQDSFVRHPTRIRRLASSHEGPVRRARPSGDRHSGVRHGEGPDWGRRYSPRYGPGFEAYPDCRRERFKGARGHLRCPPEGASLARRIDKNFLLLCPAGHPIVTGGPLRATPGRCAA